MLSTFKIKNFKSIVDAQINFAFDEGKAPNGYKESSMLTFLEPKKKCRYVPCFAVYGANASGKTNIIRALSTFKILITNRIENLYMPNKLNSKFNTTFFELSFFVRAKKYTYGLEYNEQSIVHEYLKCDESKIYEIHQQCADFSGIVQKSYTAQRMEEVLNVECRDVNKLQKITFLNRLATNYSGLSEQVADVYKEILFNIEIYPFNSMPFSFGLDKLAASSADNFADIKRAFLKITELLQKLDIDIKRMDLKRNVQKIPNPAGMSVISKDDIYSYHSDINGNDVIFNFMEESEGTQVLAGLLGLFLSALEGGKVLIIDELERSLHPLLLIEIIKLFKDKRYNKSSAQLIFTAHNTDILDRDLLRLSEIAIVRKTLSQGTTVRKISSFEGIRNVTNFRKQYLNGAFSGIPHAYI